MGDLERARQVALRYLDIAPRTVAEVERRLARAGCAEDAAGEVIADLVRAGLLDDERYARDWTESRGERRAIGPDRLEAELRRKGVAMETARDAVADLDDDAQVGIALEVLGKRIAGVDPEDPAAVRRLAGFLRRRGYNWHVIEQVFARAFENRE